MGMFVVTVEMTTATPGGMNYIASMVMAMTAETDLLTAARVITNVMMVLSAN
jgi:hypothetical protein